MFPEEFGIGVLPGPSIAARDARRPRRPRPWSSSGCRRAAPPARVRVIAVEHAPSPRTVAALESLASTMHLALDRLDVGEIMVERRSERRLRLMLQYASDVICILDHDLTIVHVTPAVEPHRRAARPRSCSA